MKEKDEVISARTQAITLLSEDMSRKSKTTLDTLEETQEQMRQMQSNFISIEERMKKEHQRLKEEAEDRKQRFSIVYSLLIYFNKKSFLH